MTRRITYPKSFPNPIEEKFIDILICPDDVFANRFEEWKNETIFDDIDHATLGLLPLLHKRLSRLQIVDPLSNRVSGVYKIAWVKNQILLNEVRVLSTRCAEEHIPIVLLKGLALLESVYKDAGARFLADGDVLVRPEDVQKTISILKELGWKPIDTVLVSGIDTMSFGAVVHSFGFKKDPDVTIELHWHIFHTANTVSTFDLFFLRDIPALHEADIYTWEKACPLYTASQNSPAEIKRMSFESMFVHVISHGAGNNAWRPFRWVIDAVWIMRTGNMVWNAVLESAVRMNRVIDVQQACMYLSSRFGISFPQTFLDQLYATPVSRASRREYERRVVNQLLFLGNFPALWYRYWKFEAIGTLLEKIKKFPAFLSSAWRLPHIGALPRFIYLKYKAYFNV